jgi:hypothetical protein
MPALVADDFSVLVLEDELRRYPQLEHLSVRKHGPLLILESGPKGDRFAHARFRRVTRQWWSPELPGHDGRWGRIPERLPLSEALQLIVSNMPWVLANIE